MSEKILWNTVHIKVPSEFITIAKNGAVKIKPPLTRTKRISTANKQPAIQLETADVNKVMIVDEGQQENPTTYKDKLKAKREQRIKELKDNYQRQKNESNENNQMGAEDINRAEKETVHQKMARLRSLRKSVKKLNVDNIVEETKKMKPLKIKKLTETIQPVEPDEKMSALIEKLEQEEQTPQIKGQLEQLNFIYKKYIKGYWTSAYENTYQKFFKEPTGQITEQTKKKALWQQKK